jgi:hypothetical protein
VQIIIVICANHYCHLKGSLQIILVIYKIRHQKKPENQALWGPPWPPKTGFKQVQNKLDNKQTNKRHVCPPIAHVPFLFLLSGSQ